MDFITAIGLNLLKKNEDFITVVGLNLLKENEIHASQLNCLSVS